MDKKYRNIWGNLITTIPKEIGNLKKLWRL